MSRKKTSRSSLARRGNVRLGWRKRKARELIRAIKEQQKLNELAEGVQA